MFQLVILLCCIAPILLTLFLASPELIEYLVEGKQNTFRDARINDSDVRLFQVRPYCDRPALLCAVECDPPALSDHPLGGDHRVQDPGPGLGPQTRQEGLR